MLGTTERACLVIADIAGYTGYLVGSELDHAQDVLRDLLEVVIGRLRGTFKLAKIEGDAAFVYTLAPVVDASMLMDTVDATYFAFRRRLQAIDRSTTCECNACILIPSLDLKFVVHHGAVIRSRIYGREELTGTDVIVVHRLLKNRVSESLGVSAYALYTEACVREMGVDPEATGLREHVESFEGVGEVRGWVADLQARWREEQERTRVYVSEKEAMLTAEVTLPVPPAVAWSYLTLPSQRLRYQAGVTGVLEVASLGGRRGVGAANHCMHGKDAILEEIVDWRPFAYYTLRSTMPMEGTPTVISTDELQETSDGTRVVMRFGRPRSRKHREALEGMLPYFRDVLDQSFERLRVIVAEDLAADSVPAPFQPLGGSEPAVPGTSSDA